MKTKQKIFFAKIIYYFINFFLPKRAKIKRNNIYWDLNFSEAIDLHVFIFGSFEKEIINSAKKLKLNELKTIIDIGANFGMLSLQFAREFNNSKIFSVEPTDYAYKKLLRNLSINKNLSDNIKPFNIFLGSDNQKKPASIYSSWSLNSKDPQHPKHFGEMKHTNNAQIKTLDEFVLKNKISNVDFIKLDVDGYEYFVLKGGYNFLKKKKPPIFMELAPYLYEEHGYTKEILLELIYSLNYKFYDLRSLKKIININNKILDIKDGSSENILLM